MDRALDVRWRRDGQQGGLTMGTIILAYVVAILGLVMIAGGVWGLIHLLREGARIQIRLRHYAMAIGMICRLCHGRHSTGIAPTGRDCDCYPAVSTRFPGCVSSRVSEFIARDKDQMVGLVQ